MSNHQLGLPSYRNNPVYGGAQRNRALNALGISDVLWGGNYYVAGEPPDGIVTIDGEPAQRIVRLVDRKTGIAVRQTMSAADGSYRFDYVRGDRVWMLIGIDQYEQENAVIADLITATPMPYVSPV